MKNIKAIGKLSWILVLALGALGISGCFKGTGAYHGKFVDNTNGVTVVIKASQAQFSDLAGRNFTTKVEDLKFESLLAGASAFFVQDHPTSKQLLEVFWIFPVLASKQEAGGLVWFEAEVLYTILNKKFEGKAPSFEMMHCEVGTVLADSVSQTFEVGCNEEAKTLQLVRVK